MRRVLAAAYWTAVVVTAALASIAAAMPFEGRTASLAGALTLTAVCMAGTTYAPHRKDHRS